MIRSIPMQMLHHIIYAYMTPCGMWIFYDAGLRKFMFLLCSSKTWAKLAKSYISYTVISSKLTHVLHFGQRAHQHKCLIVVAMWILWCVGTNFPQVRYSRSKVIAPLQKHYCVLLRYNLFSFDVTLVLQCLTERNGLWCLCTFEIITQL